MKLKEIFAANVGNFGTPVPGYKNLRRDPSFPELLLKKVGSIREAVQYGGVAIYTAGGTIVIACQDVDALLDTELKIVGPGELMMASGGNRIGGAPGVRFENVSFTYDANASHAAYGYEVETLSAVHGYLAVVTPCNGFGYARLDNSNANRNRIGMRQASVDNYSLVEVGPMFDNNGVPDIAVGGQVASRFDPLVGLVLWRHVDLRASVATVFDEDVIKRASQAYPEELRNRVQSIMREYVNANGADTIGIDVVYTRSDHSKFVGFGYRNDCELVGSNGEEMGARFRVPDGSETQNSEARMQAFDSFVDLGVRGRNRNESKDGFVRLVKPTVTLGWALSGPIPAKVRVHDTEIQLEGLFADFVSGQAGLTPDFTGQTVLLKDVPEVAMPGREINCNFTAEVVKTIESKAYLMNRDILVFFHNMSVEVNARLSKANVVENLAGRAYHAVGVAPDRFVDIQAPSPDPAVFGGKLRVAWKTGPRPTVKVHHVKSRGRWVYAFHVYSGNTLLGIAIEPSSGVPGTISTMPQRGATKVGDIAYGSRSNTADQSTSGVITLVERSGTTLLGVVQPRRENDESVQSF